MKRVVKSRTNTKASSVKPNQNRELGNIRLISGKWRGRKLPVLNADGLRPTTDRTKETLFNWLMADIQDAVCLDLFAGSGSLGFEALSRYAQHSTFVELDRMVCEQLKNNIKLLNVSPSHVSLVQADAFKAITGLDRQYDLVFIDPPFHQDLLSKVIEGLNASAILKPNALIYIECERSVQDYTTPSHWLCIKQKQTQQVSSKLYRLSQ